jgi:hypothetical protein
VPITVFDAKGIPATRRKGIGAAAVAAGPGCGRAARGVNRADPLRGGFKVLITGPHGLERSVSFVLDEVRAIITAHVRAALQE